MRAIVKGSFSVSTSSNIIVAIVVEGSVKKGDQISCPMTDGSFRSLTLKAIEAIAPNDPLAQEKYPVALIVDSIKPAEALVGGEISSAAPIIEKTAIFLPQPAAQRKTSAPILKIS